MAESRGWQLPPPVMIETIAPMGLFICWGRWQPQQPQLIWPRRQPGPVAEIQPPKTMDGLEEWRDLRPVREGERPACGLGRCRSRQALAAKLFNNPEQPSDSRSCTRGCPGRGPGASGGSSGVAPQRCLLRPADSGHQPGAIEGVHHRDACWRHWRRHDASTPFVVSGLRALLPCSCKPRLNGNALLTWPTGPWCFAPFLLRDCRGPLIDGSSLSFSWSPPAVGGAAAELVGQLSPVAGGVGPRRFAGLDLPVLSVPWCSAAQPAAAGGGVAIGSGAVFVCARLPPLWTTELGPARERSLACLQTLIPSVLRSWRWWMVRQLGLAAGGSLADGCLLAGLV